jgi:glycogen phosphorylase
MDLIFSGDFSRHKAGIFDLLRESLMTRGDHYMRLADLTTYLESDRRRLELYADPDDWARKVIVNVASSGKFSSDRTIAEFANEIWNLKPCAVRLCRHRGRS